MSADQVALEGSDLYFEILEALIGDEKLGDLAQSLVDGALRGQQALDEVLATAVGSLPSLQRTAKSEAVQAPSVFLQQVVVEGFRGAGPTATLDLVPGPGLTLVVGRNGTGKSTFAEGLETLLTGTTARWEERSQWKDTWKNLGYEGNPRVEATLLAEGIGPCRASRIWGPGADLAAGAFEVDPATADGGKLNWRTSCESARPFLGYRQLGTVIDKPADVFDTLHEVLGLELLSDATARLNEQLKAVTDRARDEKTQLASVKAQLTASSDERLQELCRLLEPKKPSLSEVEAKLVASRREGGKKTPALGVFARSQLPSQDEWQDAREALLAAHTEFQACSSVAAEQSAALIQLLDRAMEILVPSSEVCPVCSKPLSADELALIQRRKDTLREGSDRFTGAKSKLGQAHRAAGDMLTRLPDLEGELARELGIAPALLEAVQMLKDDGLASAAKAVAALGAHGPLLEQLSALQGRAQAILAEQDDEFRRATQPLERWVQSARQVEQEVAAKQALTAAKKWLASATDLKREERFEPLQEATLHNWETLSSGSSVLLNSVKLSGRGTKRKLDLEVEVDGHGAPGVGVLSQGEINCMALSLFLPKAIHADGPFRFVMIDDPVQAMDQVKVDGLARVLHEAGQRLQVVVLTHDSRLMTSLRRLQLPCNVLEVRRSAGSTLSVRACDPAHERYIKDASMLAQREGLGEEIPRRLVPGFCKLAVEAACNQRVFTDHLVGGATFRDIEEQLEGIRSLQDLLALALLGDSAKGGELPRHLKQNGGSDECTAVFQMKETHGAGSTLTRAELITLTRRTRDLCRRVLAK